MKITLKWAKHVLFKGGSDVNDPNSDILTIKDTKLYFPVVTLSAKDNQKLSKLLSKGFERSVYWNKYKTKSKNLNTTNECRYFLKSNFVGVNRLFDLRSLNNQRKENYKVNLEEL